MCLCPSLYSALPPPGKWYCPCAMRTPSLHLQVLGGPISQGCTSNTTHLSNISLCLSPCPCLPCTRRGGHCPRLRLFNDALPYRVAPWRLALLLPPILPSCECEPPSSFRRLISWSADNGYHKTPQRAVIPHATLGVLRPTKIMTKLDITITKKISQKLGPHFFVFFCLVRRACTPYVFWDWFEGEVPRDAPHYIVGSAAEKVPYIRDTQRPRTATRLELRASTKS